MIDSFMLLQKTWFSSRAGNGYLLFLVVCHLNCCCFQAMLLLQQTGLSPSATADIAWGLGGSPGANRGGGYASSSGGGGVYGEQPKYCLVPLPDRMPFAPKDSEVAERLFIVSVPEAFPASFLEDCFCRFGNLISAFFMPGQLGLVISLTSALQMSRSYLQLQTSLGMCRKANLPIFRRWSLTVGSLNLHDDVFQTIFRHAGLEEPYF